MVGDILSLGGGYLWLIYSLGTRRNTTTLRLISHIKLWQLQLKKFLNPTTIHSFKYMYVRCCNIHYYYHGEIKVGRSNVLPPWFSFFILKNMYIKKINNILKTVRNVYIKIVKCTIKNIIDHLQQFRFHVLTLDIKLSHARPSVVPWKLWLQ